MKTLIVIELPDEHLLKETNDLYDKLKGYKCELKPMPKRVLQVVQMQNGNIVNIQETSFANGWNACLNAITGETE